MEGTRAVGASLAGIARRGDLILLAGELGTGKTAFVQGFGQALGVADPITSPTFALAQRYEGKLVVHHLDVYRLNQLHEVHELGVAELLDEGGVVLIEWGDAIVPALPSGYLEVLLTYGEGPDDRVLTFRGIGQSWAARKDLLAGALAPWANADQPTDPGRSGHGGDSAPC